MKMTLKRGFLALACAVATLVAQATLTDDVLRLRAPRTAPVTPGVWHADLVKAKAYAEQHGLPLMAVWSNGDFCSHCLQFEGAISSRVFQEAMKDSGIVFYFGAVNDGSYNYDGGIGPSSDGQEGYHGSAFYWCCRNQNHTMNWPYVRFYWPKGGVDQIFSGAQVDGEGVLKSAFPCTYNDNRTDPANFIYPGDYRTYNPAGRYVINFIANKSTGIFRNFTPVPEYNGGEFAAGDALKTPKAALELERGVARADFIVPLTRTNTAVNVAAGQNTLKVTFPGGQTASSPITWAAGEKTKEVTVALPAGVVSASASSFKLELLDKDGAVKETSNVALVEPIPNGPKNPLAVGERKADALRSGEWTMDLATALKAVSDAKAKGADTYTLCLVAGTMWCGDCENVATKLLASEAFTTWATKTHQVACVVLDAPPVWRTTAADRAKPYLLSHEQLKGLNSAVTSGSGWMTRHQVTAAQAEAARTEILTKLTKNIHEGGLLLPNDTSWPYGVPCFILARPDGSIIGRLPQFSADTSSLTPAHATAFVKRLEEMIARGDDKNEELNDRLTTTTDTISARNKTGKTGSLSFTDTADCYKIQNAPAGTDATFTLTGTSSARVILSLLDLTRPDPEAAPLAVVTNALSSSLTVRHVLTSDACAVKVSYPTQRKFPFAAEADFAFTAESTACSYTLSSDSVLTANELMPAEPTEITDGIPSITLVLKKDQAYKFVGVTCAGESPNKDVLDYDAESDTYVAKVDGATLLALTTTGGKLLFAAQEWNPGRISFALAKWTVAEKGDDPEQQSFVYDIAVRRQDGLSGTGRVRVEFVPEESRYVQPNPEVGTTETFEFLGATNTLVWAEGEATNLTASVRILANTYADSTQHLVFRLVAETDCDATVDTEGRFELTINDDDEAQPGELALARVNGTVIPASRRLAVMNGATITLGVDRLLGSDGLVAADVLIDGERAGSVDWQGRDGNPKTCDITLPMTKKASVQVALAGLDGTVISAASQYLVLDLADPAGPVFDAETLAVTATRYVALEKPASVGVTASGDDVTVVKLSGGMPGGLVGAYDAEAAAFVLDGTPTVAGTFTAVYQVVKGGVKGGTLAVTCTVADPVAPVGTDPAENAALAFTRTVADALVLDETNARLAGLLTFTVPRSGRVSAKYRPVGEAAVSFLSESWAGCTAGTFTAELESVSETTNAYELTIEARADGTLAANFACDGTPLTVRVPETVWPAEQPAEAWAGYYTVALPIRETIAGTALCSGTTTVTLDMSDDPVTSTRRMAYAGILPNGKAFSGAAALSRDGDEALLTLLSESTSDVFAGVLRLNAKDAFRHVYPCTDVYPVWIHRDGVADCEVALDAFGCLNDDPNVDLALCCSNTFATVDLNFFALTDRLAPSAACDFGKPVAWDAAKTVVTVKGANFAFKNAAAAASLVSLSYSKDTHLVVGTLTLTDAADPKKTVRGTYRGVVMPGWGAAECTSCSDGKEQAVKSPFVTGSFWFNDTYRYVDDKGRARTMSVKRGCPISIGLTPGE